jgi:hypothetical protein
MWSLRLMLVPVLCLAPIGCVETPAEKAMTQHDPKVHLGRGGPRNGYDWVVYPSVLAKWISETPEIAKGTPADEAMGRLGEPDMEYENAPGIFPWDPPGDRIVVYYVAMNRTIKTLPLSAAQYIESIELVFGNDNHYKGYWVDNPLHPFRLDAPPDRDLASLIRKGPAASTLPVVSQPAP